MKINTQPHETRPSAKYPSTSKIAVRSGRRNTVDKKVPWYSGSNLLTPLLAVKLSMEVCHSGRADALLLLIKTKGWCHILTLSAGERRKLPILHFSHNVPYPNHAVQQPAVAAVAPVVSATQPPHVSTKAAAAVTANGRRRNGGYLVWRRSKAGPKGAVFFLLLALLLFVINILLCQEVGPVEPTGHGL